MLMLMQDLWQICSPKSPLTLCHLGIKEEDEPSGSLHNSGPLHAFPRLPSWQRRKLLTAKEEMLGSSLF